jgi:hypothetical protein
MPQPRKYETAADKQAAYRRRCQAAYEEQMHSKGLPALPVLSQIPGRARWRSALEGACALLEQTVGEMRDYYEERSEGWQETERASALLEQLETLEGLLEELQTLND